MWCKFFQKEEAPNLLKSVQFVCSVPVSNAFVERIFSVMGNVWTDERNRLAVNTVKIYARGDSVLSLIDSSHYSERCALRHFAHSSRTKIRREGKTPIHLSRFPSSVEMTTPSTFDRESYRVFFSSDEAHFWLNSYVNKQNCCIWSEANPQVYVETPLHPEKLTVWCALWAGGIVLQKR
ncbi:hypothetical protein TNCV_873581 [Trichonephila clavipes]|nr:hypothetical protein TNCV_873581 [Trichonephila clavipes]